MGAVRKVARTAVGAFAIAAAVLVPVSASAATCDGQYTSWSVNALALNATATATKSATTGSHHLIVGVTLSHNGTGSVLGSLRFPAASTTRWVGYVNAGSTTVTFNPPMDAGSGVSADVFVDAAGVGSSSRGVFWGYTLTDAALGSCSVSVSSMPSNSNVTVTNTPHVEITPTPLPVTGGGGSGGEVTLAGFTGEGETLAVRMIEGLGLVVFLVAALLVRSWRRGSAS